MILCEVELSTAKNWPEKLNLFETIIQNLTVQAECIALIFCAAPLLLQTGQKIRRALIAMFQLSSQKI